jgi:GT2 family glycosyltransferase
VADLSIVIPTFDTGPMTLGCCRAVLAAMPATSELIVVDDGSTDGTAGLLEREVPAVRLLRLASNRGFATAANRGAAAARGSIILLLNSDALVEAGALTALVAAFENDPDLGVAGALLLDEDGSPQWSGGPTPTLLWMAGIVSGAGPLVRFFRRSHNVAARREVDWVSGAAMAFRREVWLSAGPLNERYSFYCQDIDVCLAAREAGWRVRIVPEARIFHTLGATVAGRTPLRHNPEHLWPDLVLWGTARYGRRWALLARPTLVTIAALRIAFRKLRRPLRVDETTDALVRALRRLASPQSEA